jgi:type IV secretion system protein VirB10
VLLVCAVGIAVLWAVYFALAGSEPERPRRTPQRPTAAAARDALERLQREAREAAMEREEALKPEPPRRSAVQRQSPPPPPPRPNPDEIRQRQRQTRAFEAEVLASGFTAGAETARALEGATLDPDEIRSLIAEGNGAPFLEEGAASEPDRQRAKQAFLRRAAEPRSWTLDSRLSRPPTPYTLQAGTRIPAILTAGIHSDLPGQTTALVRRDVYDTLTGRHLLIPRGARLVGEYDSRVAWGERRVLVAWQRLIFPDGRSLDLQGMPGTDVAGMAGFHDRVDNHFVRTFGGALLLSAISAGAQLSQPQESTTGNAPSARQVAAAAVGQELTRTGAELVRRNFEIAPTLTVRPGYPFQVELTADVALPAPYRGEG